MNNSDFGDSVIGPRISGLARKYKVGGKVEKVMHEFKHGQLHSGSKKGPVVRNRKQAIAIALSEKRKQLAGKYAVGGQVKPKGKGFWKALQDEIANHRLRENREGIQQRASIMPQGAPK